MKTKNTIYAICLIVCGLLISIVPHSVKAQTISTIAGTGVGSYSGDGGMATGAKIYGPNALYVDSIGTIYFCDADNDRVRKISTSGIITTVAGTGMAGYSGDGLAATNAQLNQPSGIIIDTAGNIYIGDLNNHRVRKITPAGIISTFAGTGTASYTGDGGAATAATFNKPYGLALDNSGNLFVVDHFNHRVRKIVLSTGIVTTFAGTGTSGYSGDGGAANTAQIYYPNYIIFDGVANFYITDNGNHRIRKINGSGIISTVVGTGIAGYSGDGGAATAGQLNYPAGIRLDKLGNLYIAGNISNVVRKVNTSGVISTICGTGVASFAGDGGAATAALINNPLDVAIDTSGNVLIADYLNNRIRKIYSPYPLGINTNMTVVNSKPFINIHPNPNNGSFTLSLDTENTEQMHVVITNIIGQKIEEFITTTNKNTLVKLDHPSGLYLVSVNTSKAGYTSEILIY